MLFCFLSLLLFYLIRVVSLLLNGTRLTGQGNPAGDGVHVDGCPDESLHLNDKAPPTRAAQRCGVGGARLVRRVLGLSMRPFRLPSAKVLCREIPINQFIQHCVDIVRAPVLVIQIVGVFPHVDGQ